MNHDWGVWLRGFGAGIIFNYLAWSFGQWWRERGEGRR